MSKSTREIVSLQLGHYSNFIGTHWWNLQEASFIYDPNAKESKEINHDVLFREGRNLKGEVTYTPRLISVDLKNSLNTLKQDGILYDIEAETDIEQWTGDVTMHKEDPGSKNEFLRDLEKDQVGIKGKEGDEEDDEEKMDRDRDAASEERSSEASGPKIYNLDDSVHVWSDFLRVHLHPKTLQIINSYAHQETETFDVYGYGEQVYKEPKFHSEIDDKLHFYLEECDNLQGVHLLVDVYNGFGGVAGSMLEDLIDDYGSKGIAVFGCSPPVFPDNKIVPDCFRMMNTALSFEKLTSLGSIMVPLNLNQSPWRSPGPPPVYPHLNYKPDLMYHSSALLAAALDTASLPYRLDTNPSLITHLTAAMTPVGRKVLGLYSSLPFPLQHQRTLLDSLINPETDPWSPLSPLYKSPVLPDIQSVSLRGVPLFRLKGPPSASLPPQLNNCDSIEEMLQIYLQETYNTSSNAICSINQGCKVTDPFPHVFNSNISKSGELSSLERPSNSAVESVPLMTSLQNTNAAGHMLRTLHGHTAKLNYRKFHKFIEAGLEEDEFTDRMDSLLALANNYEHPRESDSDSD